MFLQMLRGSDVADVVKLCSPSLFTVLSTREVAKEIRALVASRNDDRHGALVARHRPVHAGDAHVVLDDAGRKEGEPLPEAPANATAIGSALLRIYFRELFRFDETLLDLRPSAVRVAEGDVVRWAPAPLSVQWKPAFIEAVRGLYAGFYGDDDALFRRSLATLNLMPAEALFRKHFGEGDQHAVTFSTREFTRTFGAVFEACAKAGSRLDADFLPFGFLLASLFQSLERLGVPLDVRKAFEDVQQPQAM